jgi:hypothetical protein
MRSAKDLLTVRRAAIAAAMVVGIVVPSLALHALVSKGSGTNVAVGLVPAVAIDPTTVATTVPADTVTTASNEPTTAAPTTAPATTAPPTTVAAPPSGPGQATSYSFSTFSTGPNSDKTRILWSKSAAIHYAVNLTNAPAGAAADLTQAIAAIHKATGLNFVADPPTTHSTDNAACTVATTKTCWANTGAAAAGAYAPVLIGWSPATAPILTTNSNGDAMGSTVLQLAKTSAVAPSVGAGDFELVSGIVVFNATATANLPAGFGGSSQGAVMLHELGHLVGLAHVADPDQMMFGSLNGHLAVYGAGDLAGLALAGQGVTYPVVPRPPTQP